MNAGEGLRHKLVVEVFSALGGDLLVPWPVLVEVDFFLRNKGFAEASLSFQQALLDGVHSLVSPSEPDLQRAVSLARKYSDSGVDLPDLMVMAIAEKHKAKIITWDFRHFRSVLPKKNQSWDLLIQESELPK